MAKPSPPAIVAPGPGSGKPGGDPIGPGIPPMPRLHLRVQLGPGPETAMGPGKADFLAAVDRVGTIVGAGRALGLSYKKARTLFDALNAAFCGLLIETVLGGHERGGARLTPLGAEVLACYRAIELRAAEAAEADLMRLVDLAKVPSGVPAPAKPATTEPGPRRRPGRPARSKATPDQRSSE